MCRGSCCAGCLGDPLRACSIALPVILPALLCPLLPSFLLFPPLWVSFQTPIINPDTHPWFVTQSPLSQHITPPTHTQSALAKERREVQQQQQRTLLEAIPKDLSRPWEDPMPEEGERHLAAVREVCEGVDV